MARLMRGGAVRWNVAGVFKLCPSKAHIAKRFAGHTPRTTAMKKLVILDLIKTKTPASLPGFSHS